MTKQPQNTDGKFWAYRNVASVADSTGRYRALIHRFSELYNWSSADLAEAVAQQPNHTLLLPPMTRAEWDALAEGPHRIGYVSHPDPSLEIDPAVWS